jgi:hypothetical protein
MKHREYGEATTGPAELWDGDTLVCMVSLTVTSYENRIPVGPTHNGGEATTVKGTVGFEGSFDVNSPSDGHRLFVLLARKAHLRLVPIGIDGLEFPCELVGSDSGTHWRLNLKTPIVRD